MECNKDEAVRAKTIAEGKMESKDYNGAKKFALKAQNLYPSLVGIDQMLTTIDVCVLAENKSSGEVDWYGVLGVTPSVDDETLRKHYRKLALVLHPDKNKSNGADGAFKLLSEAWNLLSDKSKRLAYDQQRGLKGFQQKVKTHNSGPAAPSRPNGSQTLSRRSATSKTQNTTQNTTAEAPKKAQNTAAKAPLKSQNTTAKVPSETQKTTVKAPAKDHNTTSKAPSKAKNSTAKAPPKAQKTAQNTTAKAPPKDHNTTSKAPSKAQNSTAKAPPKAQNTTATAPLKAQETTAQNATAKASPEAQKATAKATQKAEKTTCKAPSKAHNTVAEAPPKAQKTTTKAPPKAPNTTTKASPKVKRERNASDIRSYFSIGETTLKKSRVQTR